MIVLSPTDLFWSLNKNYKIVHASHFKQEKISFTLEDVKKIIILKMVPLFLRLKPVRPT